MRVGGEIFTDRDAPVEPRAFFYLAAPLFQQAGREQSPPEKNVMPSETGFLIYRRAAFPLGRREIVLHQRVPREMSDSERIGRIEMEILVAGFQRVFEGVA